MTHTLEKYYVAEVSLNPVTWEKKDKNFHQQEVDGEISQIFLVSKFLALRYLILLVQELVCI